MGGVRSRDPAAAIPSPRAIAERGVAAGTAADEARGDGEDAQAEPFRFPAVGLPGEGKKLRPYHELAAKARSRTTASSGKVPSGEGSAARCPSRSDPQGRRAQDPATHASHGPDREGIHVRLPAGTGHAGRAVRWQPPADRPARHIRR
jgi:hypothetical protein